jgi:hypothetical protein
MLLFSIILLGLITISSIVIFWMELSITNNRLQCLEERLTKLEKDAVKITFTGKPNPKQMNGIKSDEPFVKSRNKRKPKTVGEWENEIDLGGQE